MRYANVRTSRPSALFVWGGWLGHEPKQCVEIFGPWLESQGYRVELRALKANDMWGHSHLQDITVKHADQPARLDLILALFGHAGVYRTYGWAGNNWSLRKVPSTGGSVGPAFLKQYLPKYEQAGHIKPLSLMVPQAYSIAQARQNIADALRKIRSQHTA